MVIHSTLIGADLHYPLGHSAAGPLTLAANANAVLWEDGSGNDWLRIDTVTPAITFGSTAIDADVSFLGLNSSEFRLSTAYVLARTGATVATNDGGFFVQRTAASFAGLIWDESADEWVAGDISAAPWGTANLTIASLYSFRCGSVYATGTEIRINDDAAAGVSETARLVLEAGSGSTDLHITTLTALTDGSVSMVTRSGASGTTITDQYFMLGESSAVSRTNTVELHAGDGTNVITGQLTTQADGRLYLSAFRAAVEMPVVITDSLVWLEKASDAATGANEGALYTKDVTGTTHLFYRVNSSGTVYQLTPGGGGGGTLDTAYDFGGAGAGRTITADSGAVLVTDATVGRTAYLLEIENGAAAFTGTPHGILIDFATATSITNAADVYGIRMLGETNAGAGSSIGISLDSAWDYAIRSGASIAFDEIGADPTAIANAGLLYAKDASAYAELFYRADNSAAVLQLTRQGYLNAAALGIASQATGDILYALSATAWARLAAGTATYVLTANGAGVAPSWQASVAGVTDHGALTGLADDDHTQYALLAGRAGGQVLIGGTASGDDLTFESTSHATKGSVFFRDTDIQLNSNAAAGTDEDVLLTLLGGDGTTNLWRSIFYHDGGLGISGIYQNVNAADRSNGTQFHIDRADVVTSRGAGIVFNAGTGAASISSSITLEASGIVNILGSTGGMLIRGGTASGNDLTFETTSHATKGTFIWSGACDWSVGGGVGTAGQVLTSNGAAVAPTWQAAGGGSDHGALTGLGDDDHAQYALLAGRATGQILIGGTASGDDLTFESTSHATKGSVFFRDNDIDLNSNATTASESCTLHLRAGNGTVIRDWRMFVANSATSILQLQKFDDGVLASAHNLALGDSTSTAVFTSSLDKLKLGVGTTMGTNTFLTFLTDATNFGAAQFNIPDHYATAFLITQGANEFIKCNTTNGNEVLTLASDSNTSLVLYVGEMSLGTVSTVNERFRTAAVSTTDATQTTLVSVSPNDNDNGVVEVHIAAVSGSNTASYFRLYRWKKVTGTATVYAVTTGVVDSEDAALTACDVTIDASAGTFRVRVTGIAATSIDWTCSLRYMN